MGAIAEAMTIYAEPLLEQTDGSLEQMNKALTLSQCCYNLALLPADERSNLLAEMQRSMQMDDEEFEDLRDHVIFPMIRRHEQMFPFMHRRDAQGRSLPMPSVLAEPAKSHTIPAAQAEPPKAAPGEKYPGTDRYAPCPCNSGEKYKFCCGAKGH
jgi:hypothetical protein